MDSILSNLCGVSGVPEGVPGPLAIAIAVHGYSPAEARAAMVEGGDADKADEWIGKLMEAGYFQQRGAEGQSFYSDDEEELQATDPGKYLWDRLLESLQDGENEFKHQITVLDNCIKNTGGPGDHALSKLSSMAAADCIPFYAIRDNCPWHGCKFASNAVMHMISKPTAEAKREACRTASRSLGGCVLPADLESIRWPYVLSKAFNKAVDAIERNATALCIHVTDVEIMRNPAKRQGIRIIQRPGTFAHVFVMTISQAGVYLHQAYGPRGYTLLQNMEAHQQEYPLTLDKGKSWVMQFEQFAASLAGVWTEETNAAYKFCFDVDLAQLGCMAIGSQMDVYVQVEEHVLDSRTVKANFELLPQPSCAYPACSDGKVAKAKRAPQGYIPDGGVPHRYIPTIKRCLSCGNQTSSGGGKNLQCSRCKKACYCSKECQIKDWKLRHKKICNQLQTTALLL